MGTPYEYYRERGIVTGSHYDPGMLAQLDLPFDADQAMVKKRFRELAERYHPDAGGDAAAFIALMKVYEQLTGK